MLRRTVSLGCPAVSISKAFLPLDFITHHLKVHQKVSCKECGSQEIVLRDGVPSPTSFDEEKVTI